MNLRDSKASYKFLKFMAQDMMTTLILRIIKSGIKNLIGVQQLSRCFWRARESEQELKHTVAETSSSVQGLLVAICSSAIYA